jgi:hypothetical protein
MRIKPSDLRQDYAPLHKIVKTLNDMVRAQGDSYSKLSDKAGELFNVEISRFQIKTVSYENFAETKIIDTLDSYFNLVLKLLGKTDKDLLDETNNQDGSNYRNDAERALYFLPEEERNFVLDKKNKEYINVAYNLYKQKKDREKLEAMMKKLG